MQQDSPQLNSLINQLITSTKLRSKSMIMTIFGDVVSLYSGSISLIHIIFIAKNFGFTERLIRTSVHRLSKDSLLEKRQQSNKSYYSLSDKAQLLFDDARRKVYYHMEQQPEEYWTLVHTARVHNKQQADKFEKTLVFEGFAHLTRRLLFSPKSRRTVYNIAKEFGLETQIVIFKANISKKCDRLFVKQLLADNWKLQDVIASYEKFNAFFQPILQLTKSQPISDKQALILRLILIHEYRKIILKDPGLPNTWLPSYWPYETSYQICKQIYVNAYAQSANYLKNDVFQLQAAVHDRFSQ